MSNRFSLATGLIAACLSILSACQSEYKDHPAYKDLTYKERTKLKQYVVQGKELYEIHCQSCHQNDGSGLGKLIPPLHKSKYISNSKASVACIIKHGLKGPRTIDSVTYDGVMPPNNQLTNLEIAEIITFVGNNWENTIGLVSAVDAESALTKCQ